MVEEIAENDRAIQQAHCGVKKKTPSYQVGKVEVAVTKARAECDGLNVLFVVERKGMKL